MTEGLMFGDERAEKWLRQRTPMGRGGDEHELDGALLFLASAASSFVTGQVMCVDGGRRRLDQRRLGLQTRRSSSTNRRERVDVADFVRLADHAVRDRSR